VIEKVSNADNSSFFLPAEQPSSDVQKNSDQNDSSKVASEKQPNVAVVQSNLPPLVANSNVQNQDSATLLDPQAKAEMGKEQKTSELMVQFRMQAEKQRQEEEQAKALKAREQIKQEAASKARIEESRHKAQSNSQHTENDRAELEKEEERAAFFKDLQIRISSVKEAFIQAEFIGKGELINKLA
jgi:hypothetical protein